MLNYEEFDRTCNLAKQSLQAANGGKSIVSAAYSLQSLAASAIIITDTLLDIKSELEQMKYQRKE